MGLLWSLFIFTTFISQITFLNMLIAIMGDTFDRVMDQKPTYSLKNKLMLMASMKSIIGSQEKEDESKIFLYVIQPVQDVDEVNEDQSLWRGKVHHMQDQIKVKFQNMTNTVNELKDHIKDQMGLQPVLPRATSQWCEAQVVEEVQH